jgi:RNA polymerase sigma-70 factor (ECF subfamily)
MLVFYFGVLETDEERITFAAFYEEHLGKCLAAARSITNNRSWAEDAVQNAFLRMIRHKEKYFSDERKRTRSTIVIMVKSEAFNILKRENRLEHSLLENAEPFIADGEPDMSRIIIGKESLDRLKKHLSTLDEVSQTLFEMKYILEMTDGEIAKTVGLSKNAVALRLHRMTKAAHDVLEKEGFADGSLI